MTIAAEHDYVGRVREEIVALEAELGERGVRDALTATAATLGLPPELALAAIYRAARRSGLSMRLMLAEVEGQLEKAGRPGQPSA
jgi:hypothetical protein